MDYVYLDWNVIQYMKHSTVEFAINGPDFFNLVKVLSKKYRFPFSVGHLRDLAVSFHPNNQENIDTDLKYLNTISQGYALDFIPEDEILLIKDVDIYNSFKVIISEHQEEPEFKINGESYSVDMHAVSKDHLFKPFLENSGGILNSDVMSQFINNLWLCRDDSDFYKKFRQQVSEVNSKFECGNTVLSKESDYYKRLIPLLEFLSAENPEGYIGNFEDVIKSFCSINGRCFYKMTVADKIQITYMILDFHPKFRDKMTKKNRPSNVERDCNNFYFASQAKYFVTEDSSTFKKASFVRKALSLRVKVTSMSDFMAKFC